MATCPTCDVSNVDSPPNGYFSLPDLELSKTKGCRLCSLLLAGLTQLPMLTENGRSASGLLFAVSGDSWWTADKHDERRLLRLHVHDSSTTDTRMSALEIYTLPGMRR
jgi:hypothetical protein